MTAQIISQAQELVKFANEIGYGSLPYTISNNIARVRKLFAKAIDTNVEYSEQMNSLIDMCKQNDIEFVNADVFGDLDDTGMLRVVLPYNNPTNKETGEILIDILIGLETYTDDNVFIVCTDFADVVLSINEQQQDIEFQDIRSNELAIMIKGDSVSLQVNNHVVDANGRTFVYDGCHKLYVITSDDDRVKAKEYGYIVDNSTMDNEIEHPIKELEQYYLDSCPLRFICYFDLRSDDILPQDADCPMFIYY